MLCYVLHIEADNWIHAVATIRDIHNLIARAVKLQANVQAICSREKERVVQEKLQIDCTCQEDEYQPHEVCTIPHMCDSPFLPVVSGCKFLSAGSNREE